MLLTRDIPFIGSLLAISLLKYLRSPHRHPSKERSGAGSDSPGHGDAPGPVSPERRQGQVPAEVTLRPRACTITPPRPASVTTLCALLLGACARRGHPTTGRPHRAHHDHHPDRTPRPAARGARRRPSGLDHPADDLVQRGARSPRAASPDLVRGARVGGKAMRAERSARRCAAMIDVPLPFGSSGRCRTLRGAARRGLAAATT